MAGKFHVEDALAVTAALFVLFTAMIDPVVSFALAALFLVVLALYLVTRHPPIGAS